jgi:hypothetical protein
VDSVLDSIGDAFESAFDAIANVVEDIWNEIVAPIAEEIMGWLGFEGQTIITHYVTVTSLYGDDTYVNPFKKIPINRVFYETGVYDEIMNIYISGEHVRIKFYMRKIEKYGRTPYSSLNISTLPYDDVQDIIEAQDGEPITIRNMAVRLPNTLGYIKDWLDQNQALTGYFFDSQNDRLWNNDNVFYIDPNIPYVYDPILNHYEVYVYSGIETIAVGILAINGLAAPALTYETSLTYGTAVNILSSPAPTYSVTPGPVITVIADTAVDDHVPVTQLSGQRVVADTAIDDHEPIAGVPDPQYPYYIDVEQLFPYFVPFNSNPVKRFETLYTKDSDTLSPQIKYWWYYDLEPEPRQYPQLYPDDPIFPGGAKQVVLPIVPLKHNGTYIHNLPKTNQEHIEVKRSMRRYGLNLKQIAGPLEKNEDEQGSDLNSIFFLFGINVAKASSQAEIAYLYHMFVDYTAYSPDLNVTEYLQNKRDFEFIKRYLDGRRYYRVTKGRDYPYWELNYREDEPRIIALLAKYIDPIYDTYYTNPVFPVGLNVVGYYSEPNFENTVAPKLDELFDAAKGINKGNQVSFTIVEGQYNITISYAYAEITSYPGTIGEGDVGESSDKEIIAQDYQLILRHQTAPGVITEVYVLDLTGFSYVTKDGISVYYNSLDFVGDDVGDANIKNNMVVPITYGYMLDLGIVKRKELLYRAAHTCYFSIVKTELEWYETEEFAKFLGNILKIIAIVVLVVSYGQGSGVSNVLWGAAKLYGTRIIAEFAIQQMLLAFPNNPLAFALAVGIAIYASSLNNPDAFATTLDTALTTIKAVDQVTTQYTQIEGEKLIEEQQDFLEKAEEKNERLKQAIDNQDFGSASLLAYIKQTITMKYTTPESFYEHRLTRDLVDKALDLDELSDVEKLLNLDNITRTIKET